MFKIRAILLVSVALFFCSSVNTLPARSFLESITDNSKRQGGLYWNFCLALQKECIEVYGEYSCEHDDDYGDPFGHCRGGTIE